MFGFETVGNATLIAYDQRPVLVTDPWIYGEPYFGSWDLPYEIPPDQMDAIAWSEYVWFSHGHPDHLNEPSLRELTDKKILLPDHEGGRIASQMREAGLNVQILPTKQWVQLSPKIRVLCVPDMNQDAVLVIAMGNHVIINLNDSSAIGYTRYLRRLAAGFERRYLLALRNYGECETKLYDEQGNFLPPASARKPSVGRQYELLAKKYGGTHIIPFSIFHRYQREDSVWAAEYTTPLSAHFEDYTYTGADLLPAFVQIDFEHDKETELRPSPRPWVVKPPAAFGDDWSDSLDREDVALCRSYFQQKEHVARTLGFIDLSVGGRTDRIVLNPHLHSGLTLEVPRNSLMQAVRYEVFDDLVIGNFMKVTLHGVNGLYPDFTPYVAKYADNGCAQSEEELRQYFRSYRKRASAEYTLELLRRQAKAAFRRHFSEQSQFFQMSKGIYQRMLA